MAGRLGTSLVGLARKKKEAEQDAARQALLHLWNIRARRPKTLPTTLRLPEDVTVEDLLCRYLPEMLRGEGPHEVLLGEVVLGGDLSVGDLCDESGNDFLVLDLRGRQEW